MEVDLKRYALVVLAVTLSGCALIEGWVLRGGYSPDPSPSPVPSPSPTLTPGPPCALPEGCDPPPPVPPSPVPSPTPKPSPSVPPSPPPPSPCPSPKPQCVTKDGSPAVNCVSCAQFIAENLASGELIREGALVYNIGTKGKEYFDPRTCFTVWPDGSLRNKRYINDGTVCDPPGCSKEPPVPCVSPKPSSPPSSPDPQATPATCPPLMRVGGGLYNCQRNGIPKSCDAPLDAGDHVTLDSTHHFGRRTASACDEPWDKPCGGRICDDQTNGTKFTVIRGGSDCRKTGTHQLTCAPLVSGRHLIRLCPNDDYRDAHGQQVDTARAECTDVEFDVR